MSGFREIEIGELLKNGAILEIQDGNHGEKHPKASDYVPEGIPFIMANNVQNGWVDIDGASKILEGQASKLRIGFAKPGDVLLTHKGTVGNTAVVTEADPYLMLTPQVTYYRTNPRLLDNHFLHYAFREPLFYKRMVSLAQQATRPYIGIKAQRRLSVRYCTLATQRRIASILSAYDDLIENNRRRIRLLEEAARLLYREWFVHFRFPGHEHVKITDGVPEGWERKTLGEVTTLNYGKALKADARVDGVYPVFGSSGAVGTHEKSIVDGPGIILGRKGNVGSVFWSSESFWPIDTVYFISKEETSRYLYFSLQHMQFVNSDVAVPGLNRNYAYSRPHVEPRASLLNNFDEYTTPIFEQIETLEKQNNKLRAARDLLLPRLMNGEIAV